MTVLLALYVNKFRVRSLNTSYFHLPELIKFPWVFWKMNKNNHLFQHWYMNQILMMHTLSTFSEHLASLILSSCEFCEMVLN